MFLPQLENQLLGVVGYVCVEGNQQELEVGVRRAPYLLVSPIFGTYDSNQDCSRYPDRDGMMESVSVKHLRLDLFDFPVRYLWRLEHYVSSLESIKVI